MKITKSIRTTLAALFALSLMTACGTDSSNLTSTFGSNDLQTLAYNTNGAPPQQGFGPGRPGQRGGKGHGHGGPEAFGIGVGPELFADLNLTDEQKTALQALRDEYKPQQADQATPPDATQQAEIKSLIETAFLAETFDAEALKAKWAAYQPDTASQTDHITQEAELMVKSWNILTADQKATLKAKQAEMKANCPTPPSPPDQSSQADAPRPNPLAQILDLSDDQVAALDALQPERPDPSTVQAQQEKTRAAIQAELDKDSPSVDAIVEILTANRPAVDDHSPVDRLAAIHDILTADQRQAFVNAGLALGKGGPDFGGNLPPN